jgi:hypothetical protein
MRVCRKNQSKTNPMKTNLNLKLMLVTAVFFAALFAFTYNTSALTLGDEHELGTVNPSIPEGDADITSYLNAMIPLPLGGSIHVIIGPHDNLVTRNSFNDFGLLPKPASLALRGTGTGIDLGAVGTFEYLFAHYGGPDGGFAEVWFGGDLSGGITIPATGDDHALSGWALFTAPSSNVPDTGSTLGLLFLALIGLLGASRFRSLRFY